MQRFGILELMLYILGVGSILFMIPAYMLQRKNLIQEDDPHQQLLIPGQAYEILKAKRYSLKVAQRSNPFHPTTLQEFFQKLNLW